MSLSPPPLAPLRLPRRTIGVFGADAAKFLDNLLTQRLRAEETSPRYAGLLTPQGKLIADMIVWPATDGFILDVAERRAEDLLRRLRLFKLRAAVTIDPLDLAIIAGQGAADPRADWLPARSMAAEAEAPTFSEAAFAAHEAYRVAAGAPDPSLDAAPEEVFALEALFEELNGVDFHKGCFVGQENVSRMKRRATTRRKFCRVAYDGPAPPFGTTISAGDAPIGDIRSGVEQCAIALLRLDRAVEALSQGARLHAAGRAISLAAPSWLLFPRVEKGDD